MELTLTTPALLFPTVSLLMVAYTNRFLKLAGRIRDLHAYYRDHPDENIMEQITSLRRRVRLIRNMQALGLSCLFACVLSMLLLFAGLNAPARWVFVLGLVLLLASLALSFSEVRISVEALDLALSDLAKQQEAARER